MKSKSVRLNDYQMLILKDALYDYMKMLQSVYEEEDKYNYVINDLKNEVEKILNKLEVNYD